MKKVTLSVLAVIAFTLYLHAADPIQEYVAKYKFPQGSVINEINVLVENGVLTLSSSLGNTAIQKANADTFAISSYNGTAVFTRNEAKKITGLKIDVMGISLEGIRDDKENAGNGSVIPVLPVSKSTFPMKYLPSMLAEDTEEAASASSNPF
jgi:hypothetical protein